MAKRFAKDAPSVKNTLHALAKIMPRSEIAAFVGVDSDSIGRYMADERTPNWYRGWRIMTLAEQHKIV